MKIISPQDGYHYFFGYYDLQPLDRAERLHLCHRVRFMDRLPAANDAATVGAINLESGAFIPYASTTAWNFQQGAMLRRRGQDQIAYNVRTARGFATEFLHLPTGKKQQIPCPMADLSSNGRHLLSINFSRVFDFRPGYGYAGAPDPFFSEKAPERDGIFLADAERGQMRLLISYAQMRKAFAQPPFSDEKLVVNHINFNPAGDRFVFLLRNFFTETTRWKTVLAAADLKGNLRQLTPFCVNSHYYWKNDRELLIFGSGPSGRKEDYGLWLVNTVNGEFTRLPEPNVAKDIHCIYSPDRRYIVGDGYPDAEGFRGVILIDTQERRMEQALRVRTVIPPIIDIRCDLHIRWSPSGRFLTFDSTHTGMRTVCRVDREELPFMN